MKLIKTFDLWSHHMSDQLDQLDQEEIATRMTSILMQVQFCELFVFIDK